jgi:tetratricopeptide (TPR) repeat protein
VLLLGVVTLILALSSDWFIVPSSSLTSANLTKDFVLHPISSLEVSARASIFIYLASVLAVFLTKSQLTPWCIQISKFVLLIILMFPFLTGYLYPEYGMDSRLIYKQVDQVVEDMEAELNTQQLDWDQQRTIHVQKALIASMDTTIFDEVWGLQIFQPEYQTFFLQNFLGFSNEFLNVIRRGWVFAVVGLILINLGLYLSRDKSLLSYRHGGKINLGLIVLLGLLISPKIIGYYYIEKGKFYFARGDYPEASRNWQTAAKWNPTLNYSLPYYAKQGELDLKRGCTECEAVIVYRINNAVAHGQFKELKGILARLKGKELTIPGFRYWKASLYTEQGIDAFNSGEYSLAEEFWNSALREVPISATAHYGLSLVAVKYKQFDKAAQRLAYLIRLQNFLSFRKMTITGQYYLTESWSALHQGDIATAHYFYSLYLTPDNWKTQ